MLCCPHRLRLSTILFNIVTPDCRLVQAQQLVQYTEIYTIYRRYSSVIGNQFCKSSPFNLLQILRRVLYPDVIKLSGHNPPCFRLHFLDGNAVSRYIV